MRERGTVREWVMDRNCGVIARTGKPDVVVRGTEVKHARRCLAGTGRQCFLGEYLPLNSLVEFEVRGEWTGQPGTISVGEPEAINVRMIDADGVDVDLLQIELPKYRGVVPRRFQWTQNLHNLHKVT